MLTGCCVQDGFKSNLTPKPLLKLTAMVNVQHQEADISKYSYTLSTAIVLEQTELSTAIVLEQTELY